MWRNYSLRGLIKKALEAARMENANFSSWKDSLPPGEKLPVDENEVTEFIKKRTEIYRHSWIIEPLEAALKKLEKKRKD